MECPHIVHHRVGVYYSIDYKQLLEASFMMDIDGSLFVVSQAHTEWVGLLQQS